MDYIIYLIIFLIPTYLIRFSVFGIPTNVLELLVGGTCLAWLLTEFQMRDFKFKIPLLLVTGIALLTIGLLLGTMFSTDIRASLGAIKSWFVVPLVFAFIARSVLTSNRQKKRAFLSLTYSGTTVAIISLGYWFIGRLTFDGRLAAFYQSPNILAMYVAPALLILAFSVQRLGYGSQKKFLYPLIASCVFVLALTRSVGALIGIVGAMGTLLLYRQRVVWRKLWITSITVLVLVAFLLPLSALFIDPWQMARSSLASRFMVWQASFKIISQHWFFGIGSATFQHAYLAQQKNFPPFLEWAMPHPHNIFLDTYLSAGLLGFVGFLVVLSGFFINVSEKKESFVVSCLLLVVSYVIIHGTLDNTLWRNDSAIIFFLAILLVDTTYTS